MSIDVKFDSLLTDIDFINRISTCNFLFQRHERDSFLRKFITGDEIWILYQNVYRKCV